MNFFIKYISCVFLFCDIFVHASPVNVGCGGTDMSSLTAYAIICGGTTTTGAFQNVSGVGSSGQGLMSNGASALPTWQNVLAGLVSSTRLYAGSTATFAVSPSNVVIVSSTMPASMVAGNSNVTICGFNAENGIAATANQIVAIGTNALALNSSGTVSTAVGYNAVASNTIGISHVAVGVNALQTVGTGNRSVAVGTSALGAFTASENTAVGYQAFAANTTGVGNTACGYQAGLLVQAGGTNSYCGYSAGSSNVSGNDNTAFGYTALQLATGSQMIGIGSGAGSTATTGSNNIYLGYNAVPASVSESNTIVIGNSSHSTAYMYGVNGQTSAAGISALINSSFLLGTTTSSAEFKEYIEPLPAKTAHKLLQLNPVKFIYKDEPTQEIQYGMIAEEVEATFPELVCYDVQGLAWTLRYEHCIPLLIKEFQIRHAQLEKLEKLLEQLEAQVC
jgi:hypothetical protein